MWWQNILEDNKGIISNRLRLGPITEGSILLTAVKIGSCQVKQSIQVVQTVDTS